MLCYPLINSYVLSQKISHIFEENKQTSKNTLKSVELNEY